LKILRYVFKKKKLKKHSSCKESGWVFENGPSYRWPIFYMTAKPDLYRIASFFESNWYRIKIK
jgi:hypothetical protein